MVILLPCQPVGEALGVSFTTVTHECNWDGDEGARWQELRTVSFMSWEALSAIRVVPDAVLHVATEKVDIFDESLAQLVEVMIEVMYREGGVGLAANQIGVSRQIFVYDGRDEKGARVVVNPSLTQSEGEEVDEEGCLSLPGLFYPLARKATLSWRGYDVTGVEISGEASGLEARIFQHEIDHLCGRCLLDLVSPAERLRVLTGLVL